METCEYRRHAAYGLEGVSCHECESYAKDDRIQELEQQLGDANTIERTLVKKCYALEQEVERLLGVNIEYKRQATEYSSELDRLERLLDNTQTQAVFDE